MWIVAFGALPSTYRRVNALPRDPLVGVIMTRATEIGGVCCQQLGFFRSVRSMTIGADTVHERRVYILFRNGRFEFGVAVKTKRIDILGEQLQCCLPMRLMTE
jgi:hypothetical protein